VTRAVHLPSALVATLLVSATCACTCDDSETATVTETEAEAETETDTETETETETESGDPLPERRPMFALGGVHSCDLDVLGAVRCWGSQQFGQLGDPGLPAGDYDAHRVLPGPVAGLEGVLALHAGSFHTCALDPEHAVHCWGHNGFGQLGAPPPADVPTPEVVNGLERPVELALGRQHTCARLADRRVVCFGDNGFGQLGEGSLEARRGPVAVSGIDDALAIGAGRDHTCALREEGVISCWGAAVDGQLGAGAPSSSVASGTPVVIEDVPLGVTLLRAGGLHTCVVAEGDVYCWGANDAHQIGNAGGGGQDDRVGRPARVVDLDGAVELAVGGRHTCARRADGKVYCWGANHFGQLGDGTERGRNRPAEVKGLDDAVSVFAGARHTCVHRGRGDQVCWGAGRLGQLGTGQDDKVPVGAIVGGGGWIAEPDAEFLRMNPRAAPTPSQSP
jgi:alpha-tubulin suppressor-like RCC1 family protein